MLLLVAILKCFCVNFFATYNLGNSGSAFIEVLVGRSSSNEYQVAAYEMLDFYMNLQNSDKDIVI